MQWISVKERLPTAEEAEEDLVAVIALMGTEKNPIIETASFDEGSYGFGPSWFVSGYHRTPFTVTHWAVVELPEE